MKLKGHEGPFRVTESTVHTKIIDKNNKLVALMSLTENDRENAVTIVRLLNIGKTEEPPNIYTVFSLSGIVWGEVAGRGIGEAKKEAKCRFGEHYGRIERIK